MATLPIRTDGYALLCGGTPEPVTDFTTGAPKMDPVTGAPLVAVPVILIAEGRPEVASGKVPGPVPALTIGAPLTITDLVAITWENNGRSGVAFRAASITPAAGAPAPAPAPAPAGAGAGREQRSGS